MNNSNSSLHPLLLPKSATSSKNRSEFWNGTLVDYYNFLMSEELIYHCKSSLAEPFTSLNDLTVHHVSYNEFEKQYIELTDWCEKNSKIIKEISSNTLTCYLRQKSYEDLYEQGSTRLRMFNQYSNKLIERFPDLNFVIKTKIEIISRIWNELEARFISYLDEDFDRIIQDLHHELFSLEEWIIKTEEQLEKFEFISNEKISLDDFEQLIKLQNEIKSKNSCVSSVLEICERLKTDYQQLIEQIPFDYATDLENQWHQLWIYSVEIQCKLEERYKLLKYSTSISLIDENEEDDIIPFNSSEYEKISLTSSRNSLIKKSCFLSLNIFHQNQHMSLNIIPNLSPSIFYYSLTNINDFIEKTSSKLDIGYASEDDFDKKPINLLKKSQSDSTIFIKLPTSNLFSPLTRSLPLLEHRHFLPEWWRHSITSAYDTCSNPDIDLSIEETKKVLSNKPSLLIYNKKYHIKPSSPIKSNSYDASAEYTDADQSENDVDILSRSSPIQQHSESLLYNRYTTMGYSIDESQLKIENSEPCWDGYQNPLFYPLNSQDIDSIETTLKWDDQFFEMDQINNSTTDDELPMHSIRNNKDSSLSLITSVTNKQEFDSDSDLDDFNYVINETEKQLLKTRQSLEKKKRSQQQQQQLTSISNDRNQRKYDEISRTCQTNIQCLQKILTNLHHSKNSHLNNTRAIELLQTYLSDWHDMQEQVNDDRIRTRHLLNLTEEIIQLKLHLDNEFFHINTIFNHLSSKNYSLENIKQRIYYEFDLEKQNRQKLNRFYNDIHLAEEHLKEYHMTYPDGPSSFNIDEHLHSSQCTLDQLMNKMNSYQIQLRTLLTMIENLLSIENHIEQKLISQDYPIDFNEIQILIDDYERMISQNNFYHIIKHHCECKVDFYKKMFHDLIRKQEKHVSFNGSINLNNNNSTTINSTSSSPSNSSTPQQNEKLSFNKFRQNEIRDQQQNLKTSEITNKQSTTSSYISDDCKVLYIETVIEVDKPIFYERTTDTISTKNSEYHHHHHNIPFSTINTNKSSTILNRNKYFMDTSNNNNNNHNHVNDSSDDDASNQHNDEPVNSLTSRRRLSQDDIRQQNDSGVGLNETLSSSTLYDQQRLNNDQLLFPPENNSFDKTNQPTLLRRIQAQRALVNDDDDDDDDEDYLPNNYPLSAIVTAQKSVRTGPSYFRRNWFHSLIIGVLILLILFLTYLSQIDRCSRSTIIRFIVRSILTIENEGRPTI